MSSKSMWSWHVDRSDQRKTKNSKQQLKSKVANHNTSKLVNTTHSKLFLRINSNKGRNIKNTNSILSEPKEKTGRPISDELKQAVEYFYESDQYSKLCPEKKEFVSVKIAIVKQHK